VGAGKIATMLFFGLFGTAGAILVVGAFLRWPWLVDPPRDLRLIYSQAFVRHFFGRSAVIAFTYCLGLLFIAASIVGSYSVLSTVSP
jgi:hypothetical protein